MVGYIYARILISHVLMFGIDGFGYREDIGGARTAGVGGGFSPVD